MLLASLRIKEGEKNCLARKEEKRKRERERDSRVIQLCGEKSFSEIGTIEKRVWPNETELAKNRGRGVKIIF